MFYCVVDFLVNAFVICLFVMVVVECSIVYVCLFVYVFTPDVCFVLLHKGTGLFQS